MALLSISYNALDISDNGAVPEQFDLIAANWRGTVVSNDGGRVVVRVNSPINWPAAQQGRRNLDEFIFYLDDSTALVAGQSVLFDVRASGEFAIAANVNT